MTKTGQTTFFGAIRNLELEERLRELMDAIYSFGVSHSQMTRRQIIWHFIEGNFGELKRKHYRDAISRLVTAGRARFTGLRAGGNTKDNEFLAFTR